MDTPPDASRIPPSEVRIPDLATSSALATKKQKKNTADSEWHHQWRRPKRAALATLSTTTWPTGTTSTRLGPSAPSRRPRAARRTTRSARATAWASTRRLTSRRNHACRASSSTKADYCPTRASPSCRRMRPSSGSKARGTRYGDTHCPPAILPCTILT